MAETTTWELDDQAIAIALGDEESVERKNGPRGRHRLLGYR
jgi:hypothetical protein